MHSALIFMPDSLSVSLPGYVSALRFQTIPVRIILCYFLIEKVEEAGAR